MQRNIRMAISLFTDLVKKTSL